MPTTNLIQESIRRLKSILGVRRNNLILRNFKKITITIDNDAVGLFAQLTWCAYIFQYAIENNKDIKIRLVGRNYRPTTKCIDWFSYYFDGDGVTNPTKGDFHLHLRIKHMDDLGPGITPINRTIETTGRAFFAKSHLKNDLQDEIAEFVKTRLPNEPILGIHFRGTDKKIEAQRVRYEHVLQVVEKKINKKYYASIFISTDEAAFIEYMRSKLPDKNIVFRDDSKRATDETPVHFGSQSGTDTARDAIVNCFLLAHCDSIIRTSSFLSAWSIIINPSLQVLTLNRPFQNTLWFPESEILERYDARPD